MRTIRFLLAKEFRQIFRNKTLLPIIFLMPTVQLIILPLAANYEVKNIALAVVDHDHSPYAHDLVTTITASGYFYLAYFGNSFEVALTVVERENADLILEIPYGFEKRLVAEDGSTLFLAVDAINGVKGGLAAAYLNTIVRSYSEKLRMELTGPSQSAITPVIDVVPSSWYNPHMRYQLFMVPGIIAILVTMIGAYLSALNIVKERETGTIEQINVTPIRKHHFILGKLIPFWVMGIVVFTVGMVVGWVAYGIVPVGSLWTLYFFVSIYLLAVLGLGLLISTYAETQQQSMFISFFFIMIFILMSGLFTPIESMPAWAQAVSRLNPVTYFIEVMRMVVLKGSGLRHILPHLAAVLGFGIVFNGWAILNYRKSSS